MIFRVFWLSTGERAAFAKSVIGSRQTDLTLYHTKGIIYDSELRPLAGNQPCYYLVIDPRNFDSRNVKTIASACNADAEILNQKIKKETPFVLKSEKPFRQIEGIICYEGVCRYSGYASHLIGYLDSAGQVGLAGVEKEFNDYLNLFSSSVSIEYEADALNGMIPTEELTLKANDSTNNGLILTLDQSLCKVLEESMNQHIQKGAAIILDCKSGEIKALCSRPDYEEDRIADYLSSENGELINRALSSQVVGSVFKIVVTAAALEEGLGDFVYSCSGGIMISEKMIACHDHKGHGEIGLKDAFSESCNSYFIALGQMLGGEAILEMANRFGFGQSFDIIGSISASKGNLPDEAGGLSLANLSIGQGELIASPLQIARMTAAIANGGTLLPINAYKGLYLNEKIKEPEEKIAGKKILSEEIAKIIQGFCIETVETGTGTAAKPSIGLAGGKTSSAETGIIKNGKEQLNVYFTGFYPAEDPQYVITVFAEDGVSGGKTCGPVFQEVCDFIGENFLTP